MNTAADFENETMDEQGLRRLFVLVCGFVLGWRMKAMTIQKAIDRLNPDEMLTKPYLRVEVEQGAHLTSRRCRKWGHIGSFPDAWCDADRFLVLNFYGLHLVFEAVKP